MSNRPIESLYLHIPFCEHICDYCDFTKLQYFRKFAIPYLVSLNNELKAQGIKEPLKTIYIGGGTPTSLDDDLFELMLSFLDPYTSTVEEFTVECNPESLTDSKLSIMKRHGVNRLSIGVESTNDKILAAINRHHTFDDVKKAVSRAKKMGFDNINVDLILGLPNVTKELLKKDIKNIVALDVQHISCYSLTVHEHTVFGIKNIPEPNDETARELYDMVSSYLSKKGFDHYEVSNWCLKGRESKHNLTYWKDNQYYGIGLGASSFVERTRSTNTRSLTKYIAFNYKEEKEVITLEDDEEYYIMLNLRTKYGISYKAFSNRFRKSFKCAHSKSIERFVKDGLLTEDSKGIYPTYEGMMLLDQIIVQFLSE